MVLHGADDGAERAVLRVAGTCALLEPRGAMIDAYSSASLPQQARRCGACACADGRPLSAPASECPAGERAFGASDRKHRTPRRLPSPENSEQLPAEDPAWSLTQNPRPPPSPQLCCAVVRRNASLGRPRAREQHGTSDEHVAGLLMRTVATCHQHRPVRPCTPPGPALSCLALGCCAEENTALSEFMQRKLAAFDMSTKKKFLFNLPIIFFDLSLLNR